MLENKITSMEVGAISVKDKQEKLEEKFTHMETNSQFLDNELNRLHKKLHNSDSRSSYINLLIMASWEQVTLCDPSLIALQLIIYITNYLLKIWSTISLLNMYVLEQFESIHDVVWILVILIHAAPLYHRKKKITNYNKQVPRFRNNPDVTKKVHAVVDALAKDEEYTLPRLGLKRNAIMQIIRT